MTGDAKSSSTNTAAAELGRPGRGCVVLVPLGSGIEPECEAGLRELERRGYAVRRVAGFAAVDHGRNQMATSALLAGFEELVWVDPSVCLDPGDVERLRRHARPFVAAAPHPFEEESTGDASSLPRVHSVDFSLAVVRREVFRRILETERLPVCNPMFEEPLIPFFQPAVEETPTGWAYLTSEEAFCARARRSGVDVQVDLAVRLRRVVRCVASPDDPR